MNYRVEHDPLGEKSVPENAYYGIQTLRAVENFPISDLRAPDDLVNATLLIKKAAAEANLALGRLPQRVAKAIIRAADEGLAGRFRDQFVVDVYQAGAGTSHNMNANEVLANRASEILGERRGTYRVVHPNDHVNMAQSTNDVFPAATRIALLIGLPALIEAGHTLATALEQKASELDDVLKCGRTHLQDAVPIRLGQEFSGFAANVAAGVEGAEQAAHALHEINLGATALGTGVNAGLDYARLAAERLSTYLSRPLRPAPNFFRVTQSMGDILAFSGAIRRLAVEVGKIASDLRLLSMGPRAGLSEISLPAVQPGSSIMPGKVNPSIPEMVNQVCYQVIGCDTTIAVACEGGQLELNVMMPVIAWNAIHEQSIMAAAMRVLAEKCVQGIVADAERCRELLDRSTAVATALSPHIGYAMTAEIAKESVRTGRPVRQIVEQRKLLSASELDAILSAERMTTPGVLDVESPKEAVHAKAHSTERDGRGRDRRRSTGSRSGKSGAATSARTALSTRGSRASGRSGSGRMAETRAGHGRAGDRRRRGSR